MIREGPSSQESPASPFHSCRLEDSNTEYVAEFYASYMNELISGQSFVEEVEELKEGILHSISAKVQEREEKPEVPQLPHEERVQQQQAVIESRNKPPSGAAAGENTKKMPQHRLAKVRRNNRKAFIVFEGRMCGCMVVPPHWWHRSPALEALTF